MTIGSIIIWRADDADIAVCDGVEAIAFVMRLRLLSPALVLIVYFAIVPSPSSTVDCPASSIAPPAAVDHDYAAARIFQNIPKSARHDGIAAAIALLRGIVAQFVTDGHRPKFIVAEQ